MMGVCVRCGFCKPDYAGVCPDCGHRPEGEGLLIAWLLSRNNLKEAAVAATAARIKSGESIRPSAKMLSKARRALGRQLSTDPGLSARDLMLLIVGGVLFTPLVGWTCVAWWFRDRPRAALQAGLVTLPISIVFTLGWGWAMMGGLQ